MVQTAQRPVTAQQPLMAPLSPVSEGERRRVQKIGDIADWYRNQISYDELKRAGRDVSVLVDYRHRLILVSSYRKDAHPFLDRIPPDERMEFDDDVLEAIRNGLKDKDHLVIVDTSDIPGHRPGGGSGEKCITAKIMLFDIDSGDEIGEPKIFAKPRPHLPQSLQSRLLVVPKAENNAEEKDYVAGRFFNEFLNSCITPGISGSRPAPVITRCPGRWRRAATCR